MKLTTLALLAAAAVGGCSFTAFGRTVFDAATDFSATNNPNGVWSFGSQFPTLGTGFTPHPASGVLAGFDYWSAGPGGGLVNPSAFHNPTAATITYGPSAEIHPGQMNMHPGFAGEYALARFTVPVDGDYTFSATFIGEDFIFPTTTDVHMLVNNFAVYSALLNGYHVTAASGTFTMTLATGDTIDAAVGWGVNGNFVGDSTGVDFTVEFIPAPGAVALLGLAGLLSARRRR